MRGTRNRQGKERGEASLDAKSHALEGEIRVLVIRGFQEELYAQMRKL